MTNFARDTFTDADSTDLSAHTPELGGAWVEHASYLTGNPVISGNRLRATAAGTSSLWYSPATPPSANYAVTVDLYPLTIPAGASAGVAYRVATGANNLYYARYNQATAGYQLIKVVGGTTTTIGSASASAPPLNSATVLSAAVSGSSHTVSVNGVLIIGPVIDSAIMAAGKAGFRTFDTTAPTASTGIHIDNFTAGDPVAAASPVPVLASSIYRRRRSS